MRFSTPEQARGDSLRRQIALSREYAAQQGLTLDESLRMTDAGISAFDGANIETGALGEFLKLIQQKKVPKGSYLLIEALDRLTRAHVFDALSVFMQIVRAGVRIVTIDDKAIYDLESTKNPMNIMVAIMSLARGHDESAMKSFRGGKTWAQKRQTLTDRRLTAICPGWLKPSPGKVGFVVIPERVEIVRWIYKQTLRGVGKYTLAKLLNDRGEPVWGLKGKKAEFWRTSYIAKILQNPAVIGRFQPRKVVRENGSKKKREPEGPPHENYFPAVISEEEFYAVQARRRPHAESAGRIGDRVTNLFTHVAKCGRTGSSAHYLDKGTTAYLKSSSPLPKAMVLRGWPYPKFETLFLGVVGALNIGGIFEHSDDDVLAAEIALTSARAKLTEIQTRIANLNDELELRGASQTIRERLDKRVTEEAQQIAVVVGLSTTADQLRYAHDNIQESQATLEKLISNSADGEVRLLLRQEIRRIIERIDVFFEKPETPEEAESRKDFEAAVAAAKKKGVKIFDGLSGKKAHARWFSIVFRNGVRRTVAESLSGQPLVYEGDVSESGNFQSVRLLLDPGITPPKTTTESDETEAASIMTADAIKSEKKRAKAQRRTTSLAPSTKANSVGSAEK